MVSAIYVTPFECKISRRTCTKDSLETVEDAGDVRSFLWVVVPTILSESPNRWPKPEAFGIVRFRWSPSIRYCYHHMCLGGAWKRDSPCECLLTKGESDNDFCVMINEVPTSIMTIAREYMSERVVGFSHTSPLSVIEPMSSGADQRAEPPLATSHPLTERVSLAMEERPKSAIQGTPCALMKILYYKKTPSVNHVWLARVVVRGIGGGNHTNTL